MPTKTGREHGLKEMGRPPPPSNSISPTSPKLTSRCQACILKVGHKFQYLFRDLFCRKLKDIIFCMTQLSETRETKKINILRDECYKPNHATYRPCNSLLKAVFLSSTTPPLTPHPPRPLNLAPLNTRKN